MSSFVEPMPGGASDDLGIITSQIEALKILATKENEKFPSDQIDHTDGFEETKSVEHEVRKRLREGISIWDRFTKATSSNPAVIDARKLVSAEILKFGSEERNAVYEEVHGVRSLCPEETPELVNNALLQLEIEMQNLPPNKKKAFEQSQQYPYTYVNKTDFRMRFLRAELFNAEKAAVRMAQYLENCFDLFGSQTLQRPVRLCDFTKKEMKVFNTGRIQLLPFRDRGGRRVVVGFPNYKVHSVENGMIRAKIHHYLWWVASNSVESQRKGIIFITMHNKNYQDGSDCTARNIDTNADARDLSGVPSLKYATIAIRRFHGMPIRMASFHICTPDSQSYALVRSITLLMLGSDKCRFNMHVGHDIENRFKLHGFGIPQDQLPLTETGKIKVSHFRKWMQFRKKMESDDAEIQKKFGSLVECPESKDVVFRPSQSSMCHPGNVTFRGIVESKHFDHDMAASREEKVSITRGVLEDVKNRGGRFLYWDNESWWQIMTNEKEIYGKIAIFFRNSKASRNAKLNLQLNPSSTYIFTPDAVTSGGDKRRRLNLSFGEKSSDDDSIDHCVFNCNFSNETSCL